LLTNGIRLLVYVLFIYYIFIILLFLLLYLWNQVRTLGRRSSQGAEASNAALHAALGNQRANSIRDLIKATIQQGFMFEQRERHEASTESFGIAKKVDKQRLRSLAAKECRDQFSMAAATMFDESVVVLTSGEYNAVIIKSNEVEATVDVRGTTVAYIEDESRCRRVILKKEGQVVVEASCPCNLMISHGSTFFDTHNNTTSQQCSLWHRHTLQARVHFAFQVATKTVPTTLVFTPVVLGVKRRMFENIDPFSHASRGECK